MRKIKTYVITTAALGGLLVIGSLMRSPDSQAKGAYSTPVTVMNTNAQPGSVLDAERATRIPYQSVAGRTCTGQSCQFLFSAAPPGYRLVVENVSGLLEVPSGNTPMGFLDALNAPAPVNTWGLSAPTSNPLGFSGLNQTLKAYFEPGQTPEVALFGTFLNGNFQVMNVAGYLENCALTGCPPVQH